MRKKRYNNLAVILLTLFIIVLILDDANADTNPICDYCKRIITNNDYVQTEGIYFHKKHFFCSGCSQSLVNNKFVRKNNANYCAKCYENKFILKCANCGELINGKYLALHGKNYHTDCYNKSFGLICNLCQKAIEGEFLTDYWENKYHRFHEGKSSYCDYCRRFISKDVSNGGSVYNDGRTICGICKENTVDDIREAEKLMSFISQKLKKFGIEIGLDNIKLELVDKNELTNLSRSRSKDFAGFTILEGQKGLDNTFSNKYSIFLLRGMPKSNFRSTMAHELMHVWLYSNAPLEMDPALAEGSCNYSSYLFLQNDRDKLTGYILNSMEKDPDIFYGEGYRRVKKMVRRMGIESWLEYLRDNKNFPSGY